RCRARRLRPRAPWALAAPSASPGSAALIAPWHRCLLAAPAESRRAVRFGGVIGEVSLRYNAPTPPSIEQHAEARFVARPGAMLGGFHFLPYVGVDGGGRGISFRPPSDP